MIRFIVMILLVLGTVALSRTFDLDALFKERLPDLVLWQDAIIVGTYTVIVWLLASMGSKPKAPPVPVTLDLSKLKSDDIVALSKRIELVNAVDGIKLRNSLVSLANLVTSAKDLNTLADAFGGISTKISDFKDLDLEDAEEKMEGVSDLLKDLQKIGQTDGAAITKALETAKRAVELIVEVDGAVPNSWSFEDVQNTLESIVELDEKLQDFKKS